MEEGEEEGSSSLKEPSVKEPFAAPAESSRREKTPKKGKRSGLEDVPPTCRY